MTKLEFSCLAAKQAKGSTVLSFVANAEQISQIARISRVRRDENRELHGFQRSQIGNHINEIQDYLESDEAVLPNAIILAFTDGATFSPNKDGRTGTLSVDLREQQVGLIVDGQQRFSALRLLDGKDFEVFVSAIICRNEDELQKQFILINNTKPLPKELIYELLPTVDGLPPRLTARSFASSMTQDLNFKSGGVFEGLIKIHTNPDGIFTATALHKVIMNSKSNGALRDIYRTKHDQGCLELVNDFYSAVRVVFEDDWYKKDDAGRVIGLQTPRSSRLIHSAGITALGHIMDAAFALRGAESVGQFVDVLNIIKPYCAWSSGSWNFQPNPKQWSEVQNTTRDIAQLREYLYACLASEFRAQQSTVQTA